MQLFLKVQLRGCQLSGFPGFLGVNAKYYISAN